MPSNAILSTAARIQAFLGDALSDSGITLSQYSVLRILREAGAQGLPTLEIGRRMAERSPGITRLIDRLERQGWAARRRDDADRRQVTCMLTEAGAALLSSLDERMADREAAIFASLTRHEQAALAHMLARVNRAITEK